MAILISFPRRYLARPLIVPQKIAEEIDQQLIISVFTLITPAA
ncbi:MAG: hypothetical protein ACI8RO_000988 [Flavobacteriales bacterium]|jgi:hypothetical protein